MVTSMKRDIACFALLALLPACGGTTVEGGEGNGNQNGPANHPASHWSGKGFVVHEWGTNTIVVGSDGSLQRGLHHEEEDLPGFVYDRMKAGLLEGSASVEVKMETPVTYFYSDVPRSVSVAVDFPRGVFTQWFPAAKSFYPFIAAQNSAPGLVPAGDPVLDVDFPFGSKTCAEKYGLIANGLLDWGSVEVLARGADVEQAMPPASLEQFTWSHARAVDANAVRLQGVPGAMTTPETERFLFYRGLGNFELPVKVLADREGLYPNDGGSVRVTNADPTNRVGAVFVLLVNETGGAFRVTPEGIAPSGTIHPEPMLTLQPLDQYKKALGEAMVAELDKTGLYHDEAQAMVATWQRQWFTTPGVRVLYLAPQAWTDAQIPLTISPTPDETKRAMVIRVEVITPTEEDSDRSEVEFLDDPGQHDAVVQHFLSLGRFAEPRLRRAIQLSGPSTSAQALLSQIASANTAVASGE